MKTSLGSRCTAANRSRRVVGQGVQRAPQKPGARWRAAAASALACLLAACGGDLNSAGAAAVVKGPAPTQASSPVAASAPDGGGSASVPVEASAPASEPTSTPIGASAPAASAADAASAPAVPTPPSGPASTPIVLIDVYGDDGIAGFTTTDYGMLTTVTPNEPQSLQALLQSEFNDTGITVANHATGGTSSTLQNEMLGSDGNGAPFADRIKLSSASIVIESHSRNDVYGGETLNNYRQYLAAWIVAVRSTGKIPVLEESSPVCDGQHPQLAAYMQAIDDAAAQFNVPIVTQYSYISELPGWQSHMASCLYPDSFLNAIKAQREQAVVAPLVKTLIGSQS